MDCYLAHIMLGNSGWEKAKLLTNIKENQEMILFIEAMLINHFKPKYNQQYVDKLSIKSKIYQQFNRQNVNPIVIELDLCMDKGKIHLKSKETRTETKMRNIKCCKIDDKIVIDYDDMSDFIYDFL